MLTRKKFLFTRVFLSLIASLLINSVTAINYTSRQDDLPKNVTQADARTTRQILETAIKIKKLKKKYTLQEGTEHLLQFGALFRTQILDTFGYLVYDRYDDFSISEVEALYRVYHETLERKYNIFDIVTSFFKSADIRPTKVCQSINKNVHTCLKESSQLCMSIRNHNKRRLINLNETPQIYQLAKIQEHFPDGFSSDIILKHLQNNTLKLTPSLLSGLLHNIQYDSFDDEVRTAERELILYLTKSSQISEDSILMSSEEIRNQTTVSGLLRTYLRTASVEFKSPANFNAKILAEHVVREVEAISQNIELFGTIYENNTINLKYLFNLILPPDVLDKDLSEAKEYLLGKVDELQVVSKYLRIEKYQQAGPDQLLMEILGQMRDIHFAVDIVTALHTHARFWQKSRTIDGLNELLELFSSYENLRKIKEYEEMIKTIDQIKSRLWDSKNVTIGFSCSNPRACLQIGLQIVLKCEFIDEGTKNLITKFCDKVTVKRSPAKEECPLRETLPVESSNESMDVNPEIEESPGTSKKSKTEYPPNIKDILDREENKTTTLSDNAEPSSKIPNFSTSIPPEERSTAETSTKLGSKTTTEKIITETEMITETETITELEVHTETSVQTSTILSTAAEFTTIENAAKKSKTTESPTSECSSSEECSSECSDQDCSSRKDCSTDDCTREKFCKGKDCESENCSGGNCTSIEKCDGSDCLEVGDKKTDCKGKACPDEEERDDCRGKNCPDKKEGDCKGEDCPDEEGERDCEGKNCEDKEKGVCKGKDCLDKEDEVDCKGEDCPDKEGEVECRGNDCPDKDGESDCKGKNCLDKEKGVCKGKDCSNKEGTTDCSGIDCPLTEESGDCGGTDCSDKKNETDCSGSDCIIVKSKKDCEGSNCPEEKSEAPCEGPGCAVSDCKGKDCPTDSQVKCAGNDCQDDSKNKTVFCDNTDPHRRRKKERLQKMREFDLFPLVKYKHEDGNSDVTPDEDNSSSGKGSESETGTEEIVSQAKIKKKSGKQHDSHKEKTGKKMKALSSKQKKHMNSHKNKEGREKETKKNHTENKKEIVREKQKIKIAKSNNHHSHSKEQYSRLSDQEDSPENITPDNFDVVKTTKKIEGGKNLEKTDEEEYSEDTESNEDNLGEFLSADLKSGEKKRKDSRPFKELVLLSASNEDNREESHSGNLESDQKEKQHRFHKKPDLENTVTKKVDDILDISPDTGKERESSEKDGEKDRNIVEDLNEEEKIMKMEKGPTKLSTNGNGRNNLMEYKSILNNDDQLKNDNLSINKDSLRNQDSPENPFKNHLPVNSHKRMNNNFPFDVDDVPLVYQTQKPILKTAGRSYFDDLFNENDNARPENRIFADDASHDDKNKEIVNPNSQKENLQEDLLDDKDYNENIDDSSDSNSKWLSWLQ